MRKSCGHAPSPCLPRPPRPSDPLRSVARTCTTPILLAAVLTGLAGTAEALQVLDAGGQPVVDARVKILRAHHSGGQGDDLFHQLEPPVLDAKTDAEGRLHPTLPVLKKMLLLVDHPDYGPWVAEIAGSLPRSVLLPEGLELQGEVDLGGESLRDGQICAGWTSSWDGRDEIHRWRRCSTISADGNFVLPGLADREVQLAVWVSGFVPYRRTLRPDPAEPLKIRMEAGHRIGGRVEASQTPIRGAVVRTAKGAEKVTGGDGTFELTVAVLPTHLTVEAPGFRRQTVRTGGPRKEPAGLLHEEDEEKVPGLIIELEPVEQITGILLDFDGQPLDKATVRAIHLTAEDRRSESRHPVDTWDGAFRLDLPGPGRYRFLLEAEGRRTESLSEIDLAPEQIYDLGVVTLHRGAGVVGTLVDSSTDEPVAGAVVRVVAQGTRIFDALRRGGSHWGISDETGQFEIWGLEAGRYELRPEHDDYAPSSFPVALKRDEVAELEIVPLEPGTRVSGTVLDRKGRPRSGLQIRVYDPEQASVEPLAENTSDSRGRFGELLLASGRYRFNVSGERLLLTQEIEVPPGEPSYEVELIVGGVNLSGRITRNGNPVDGGFLSVSSALDPAVNQGKILLRTESGQLTQGLGVTTVTADVGPEGTFQLADAPHGALEVTYYPLNGDPVRRRVVIPDQPRYELALEIGGLILQGRVADADSGLGIESASFRVLNDTGRTVGTGRTDASGYFEIPDLEPGEYAAEVQAENYASTVQKPLLVQADMPPVEILLSPEDSGALSIRLLREDGSAVSGMMVNLLNESGRMVRSLLSDDQGRRRYEGLPAGSYFVVWTDPLSGTGVSEPIVVQGAEQAAFERVLPTGGSVELACNWEECGGASVEHVAVFSPQGVDIGGYLSGVAPALRFSSDGQLTLGRLSRDTYLVRVWAGNRTREAVVTVDSELETVMLP